MNTRKIFNEKKFVKRFMEKIEKAINNEEFDKAEVSIKRALKNAAYDMPSKSLLYSYLGRINFQKGKFDTSKRFLNSALRLNSQNEDANFYLSNLYMSEQDVHKALSYIEKNLSISPGKFSYLIQRAWCLILLDRYEEAGNIYHKLQSFRGIDPQGFIDLGMAYILKGDFREAKRIIFNALSNFPENIFVESAFYEMREIEENLYYYRKELFFKKLHLIHFRQKIYSAALRKTVEGMTLRGYFQFEIEKASDFIVALSSKRLEVNKAEGLAAAVEYFISDFIGESESIKKVIVNYYNTTLYQLKKNIDLIRSEASVELEELNNQLMSYYELNIDYFFENTDPEGDDE
ncbi:tetratricopeptide repeat protein [Flexistipes sp.]|uniref:tetratricopeptide repeat protein n=1 Tax=Flexistipes sp. TaxID=3088135 RepID=UPI002E20C84B|nr:hypothetical protein [Flexistipes sp.]